MPDDHTGAVRKVMTVRYADSGDFPLLHEHDQHIRAEELGSSIEAKRVLVILDGIRIAGWLRYNLFWDDLPFLNMLYLFKEYRGKGYGSQLVQHWEQEMVKAGYCEVLTSTLSNEQGQFFFRKTGYTDCGALLLPNGAPGDHPAEETDRTRRPILTRTALPHSTFARPPCRVPRGNDVPR